MTLTQMLALDGTDHFETYVGLRPVSNAHPPSLRNPTPVAIPTAQDGWRRGDSQAMRDQARRDLAEVFERGQRQIGKPQAARTALFPVYPNISQWF